MSCICNLSCLSKSTYNCISNLKTVNFKVKLFKKPFLNQIPPSHKRVSWVVQFVALKTNFETVDR